LRWRMPAAGLFAQNQDHRLHISWMMRALAQPFFGRH
jgi:hypothetical protein